jgi:uncharacterized protein (DUF1501 family)
MKYTRRTFLKCGMAVGVAGSFSRFGLVNAFAQNASDYKALVCVFLFGGNDGNNLIVPLDNARYQQYKSVRGPLALTQAQLLPVQTVTGSQPFGFHPRMVDVQNLFKQGKAAVLANAGTLLSPITRDAYLAGTTPVPSNLFSHSDQQSQWQSSQLTGLEAETGWGGRIADKVQPLNSGALFPSIVTIAGSAVFCDGVQTRSAAVNPGTNAGLNGFDPSNPNDPRLLAMQQLLTFDTGVLLVQEASNIMGNAFRDNKVLTDALNGSSALKTVFPASDIGQQLQQVAKVIQVRSALGLRRQIFFVSMDGFDTHSDQLASQDGLFADLSPALGAFYQAGACLWSRHRSRLGKSPFARRRCGARRGHLRQLPDPRAVGSG